MVKNPYLLKPGLNILLIIFAVLIMVITLLDASAGPVLAVLMLKMLLNLVICLIE